MQSLLDSLCQCFSCLIQIASDMNLVGAGTHSNSEGHATKGSEEEAKLKNGYVLQ
jgi:hypothetical protein